MNPGAAMVGPCSVRRFAGAELRDSWLDFPLRDSPDGSRLGAASPLGRVRGTHQAAPWHRFPDGHGSRLPGTRDSLWLTARVASVNWLLQTAARGTLALLRAADEH